MEKLEEIVYCEVVVRSGEGVKDNEKQRQYNKENQKEQIRPCPCATGIEYSSEFIHSFMDLFNGASKNCFMLILNFILVDCRLE